MKMSENSQQNDLQQTELFQTSSLEGFPAKTYRLQETKKASAKGHGRASGQSVPVYLGSFDPISQSLKTSQHSLLENQGNGLSEFSGTYPRSGMMRSGIVFQHLPLVLATSGTGSGLLPTPTASSGFNASRNRFFGSPTCKGNLEEVLRDSESDPVKLKPSFVEKMMGFPPGWTDLKDSETP